MSKLPKIAAFAVALLAGAGSANAGVIFHSSAFGHQPAPGETMVEDFDHPIAAGYSMTWSNAGLFQGPLVPNIAAPPAGDSTKYLSVFAGGHATLTTPGTLKSLSVYLGSIDSYNTITFHGQNGFSQSFTGAQLVVHADGDQSSAQTNRQFYFDFTASDLVNEVIFSSSGNSFEFDTIAANDPPAPEQVPEPVTLSLFAAGLTGAAALRRRGKRAQDAPEPGPA